MQFKFFLFISCVKLLHLVDLSLSEMLHAPSKWIIRYYIQLFYFGGLLSLLGALTDIRDISLIDLKEIQILLLKNMTRDHNN
jgi:hypothetical protein